MPTIKDLQAQIEQLTQALASRGITVVDAPASMDPKDRPDYVEFGSEMHARLLGLREAVDEDTYKRADGDGRVWTLEDTTVFGPQVTKEYIVEVLRQKVSELDTKPVLQSTDRTKPGYAPLMLAVYKRQLED